MPSSRRNTNNRSLFQKSILPNGLRVVTEQIPSVRSISLGVWIDVGSRNEAPDENGMSHFIEHMVFKGTRKRSAKQIASSLESLGGGLNGFTSREHTCYTARVLDEYLAQAVDVLADLTCNAVFTPHNLRRERLVIVEEIKEVLDNPADLIHDIFAKAYWGEHPLGQPIMGSPENIMSLTRAKVMKYLKRYYHPSAIVIAASGAVSHKKLLKLVKEKFHFKKDSSETVIEQAERSQPKSVMIVPQDSQQTHLCLGFPGLSFNDKRKINILALNTYLGGGMSSVLFQKVREEQGLAYSVYTFHDFFRDSGIFGAYLGTDSKQAAKAYEIILRELRRVKKNKITPSKIDQVKAQLKGSLLLGMESTSNRMSRIARQELLDSNFLTLRQIINMIDRLKASDLTEMAWEIFDENQLALAVLGPVKAKVFKNVA